MRIVIIGGMGMIGSAVFELAIARGHHILTLSRKEGRQKTAAIRQEIGQWDGKNCKKLANYIDDRDAVINLAGESIGKGRWTPERKDLLLRSRLEPADALVEAFRQCKKPPRTLIQASAIGFYGTGNEVKEESSPGGEDYLARFAARWEESTKDIEEFGIRRVIIRSGIVLKKGQGVLPLLMLPFKLMAGGPVGSGKQFYSWIHIQDEACAILHLLENMQCKGIYNLTAPKPYCNADFGKTLSRVMKSPYWMPAPGLALKLFLGEMSVLVLEGQRVFPRRLEADGFKFRYPDLEGALIDLLQKENG